MTSQNQRCAVPNDIQKVSDFSIDKDLSTKLKGIAILLVILGHMNYIDCAGAWGVHLFLIVSGYGIAVSLEKNGLHKYWTKKIKSVYLPYLLSVIFFLFVRLILGERIRLLSIIASLLGLDLGLNSDPTMWYISYIFAWYAIAWILYLIKEKKYLCIGSAVILLFLMAALGYIVVIWRRGTIAWAYFASFPLGMLLAKYRNNVFVLFLKDIFLVIIIAICLTIVILDYGKPHSGIEEFVFTFSAALGVLLIGIIVNMNVKKAWGGGNTKNRVYIVFYVFERRFSS